jgi:hypothetical protein
MNPHSRRYPDKFATDLHQQLNVPMLAASLPCSVSGLGGQPLHNVALWLGACALQSHTFEKKG